MCNGCRWRQLQLSLNKLAFFPRSNKSFLTRTSARTRDRVITNIRYHQALKVNWSEGIFERLSFVKGNWREENRESLTNLPFGVDE